MTTYTGFVKAIANEVAEFTRKRAEAAAREGARENVLLGEWLARSIGWQYRGDPGQRELGLCMCPFIYVCLGLKVKYQIGQTIESADEVMIILEAMKTEINVTAGDANVGKVIKGMEKGIREGASVQAGDPLVWVS
ncbi:hypothetical protein V8E55_010456 [Tylopilus felleus]